MLTVLNKITQWVHKPKLQIFLWMTAKLHGAWWKGYAAAASMLTGAMCGLHRMCPPCLKWDCNWYSDWVPVFIAMISIITSGMEDLFHSSHYFWGTFSPGAVNKLPACLSGAIIVCASWSRKKHNMCKRKGEKNWHHQILMFLYFLIICSCQWPNVYLMYNIQFGRATYQCANYLS